MLGTDSAMLLALLLSSYTPSLLRMVSDASISPASVQVSCMLFVALPLVLVNFLHPQRDEIFLL